MNPNDIRFSQNSAGGSGRAAQLRESMRNGWNGPAVDAVETLDGIVTIDNTRIAIARELASIANNTGMIEYCQNQITISRQLLTVELNKLGIADQLGSLAVGATSVNDLLAGAQLVNGKYQYSGSQIRTLLNNNQAQSELQSIGGSWVQAVTISVTDRGQSGTLLLKYVPPGYLWGGDFYTVAGVNWSGADSRTVANQGVFNPAISANANAMLTRAAGALQVAGAIAEGTIGIAASPITGCFSLVLIPHAVDQGFAGLTSVITGESQNTVTYTVTKATAMSAGMSENSAGWLAFGLD